MKTAKFPPENPEARTPSPLGFRIYYSYKGFVPNALVDFPLFNGVGYSRYSK